MNLHLGHLDPKQNFSHFHIHDFLPIDVCTSATESRLSADANKLQTTPTLSHSLYFRGSWKNLANEGSVCQLSVCGGVHRRARSRHPHPRAPVRQPCKTTTRDQRLILFLTSLSRIFRSALPPFLSLSSGSVADRPVFI